MTKEQFNSDAETRKRLSRRLIYVDTDSFIQNVDFDLARFLDLYKTHD